MLTIRLARVGKKNKAQFQIVLQEHTVAPGGRHVEILGSYDPHSKVASIKDDRVKYWIEKGAQPSDTAYNLFVTKGLVLGKKKTVKVPAKKSDEAPKEGTAEGAEAGTKEAAVKTEEKPKEDKKEEKPKEEAKKE